LHRAEKPFSGIKGYLQKIADKSVDAYLFVSAEFSEEWIKKGIFKNKKKIHEVIQSSSIFFLEDKIVAKKILNINGGPVFLWVGRLEKNKDPVTVVKAFTKYLSFQPLAKLYMIYQDDQLLPEVKTLINALTKQKMELFLLAKLNIVNYKHGTMQQIFLFRVHTMKAVVLPHVKLCPADVSLFLQTFFRLEK
jgi:glycosyltransferase involved in cell wall biosynthesis